MLKLSMRITTLEGFRTVGVSFDCLQLLLWHIHELPVYAAVLRLSDAAQHCLAAIHQIHSDVACR